MKTSVFMIIGSALLAPVVAGNELDSYFERSNGVFSVYEAARAGDASTLRARLSEGDAANGRNEQGDTPLHLAAIAGAPDAVRTLLQAGADPLAQNASGQIASAVASNSECADLCRQYENTRHREIALFNAVRTNDAATVQAELSRGVNPDALSEDCTHSLLTAAAQAGATDTVRTLLQAGAHANSPRPGTQHPLHAAATANRADIIPLLLAAGADPMARSANGSLAIHEAIWHGRTEAALALIPAYKPQDYNPDGLRHGYPICMAIGRGNARVVQGFLEAGLDPNSAAFSQEPLLIQAVRAGRQEIVRLLLQAGADKAAKDTHGKTAADYANAQIAPLLK